MTVVDGSECCEKKLSSGYGCVIEVCVVFSEDGCVESSGHVVGQFSRVRGIVG